MNMKKTLMAAVALLGGIAMAADATYSFTYQAALRDEHGFVISNGTSVARNQTVTLRLWDAATGGNLLWGRTYNVYTDETGLFNLEVSDLAGSPANDAPAGATLEGVFTKNKAGDVHIGLFVSGSSGEIVPRQRLFAVPFAAVANDVRQISGDITVGGNITMKNGAKSGVVISADGITQQSGSSTFQSVAVNDTVTASGRITSGGGLTVNGGTVSIAPDMTLDRKLTVKGATALNAGVTVSGGDLAVDEGRKLTIGGSEVVPVPVGGIIMWTKAELPDKIHWAICNGQVVNNIATPDLRDRFIVGAGSKYGLGDKGGSDSVQLTKSQMPNHSHLYPTDRTAGDFIGEYNAGAIVAQPKRVDGFNRSGSNDARVWKTGTAGGDARDNYMGNDGYAESHENRPPYYALYYIMRVK